MTTPIITMPTTTPTALAGSSTAIQEALLEPNINLAVSNAQAAVNVTPPGAVQSAIDFTSLGDALLDYVQLAGDVGNVFLQDFEAAITEGLAVANLVAGIIAAAGAAKSL
jgi:hypothetical protein